MRYFGVAATTLAGADLTILRRLIYDDKKALDLLDQALKNEPGRPRELFDGTLYNIQGHKAPSGTSIEAALRRLRSDDRPIAKELHAKVLAGELSAHRAAVLAGYRKEPRQCEGGLGEDRPRPCSRSSGIDYRKPTSAADGATSASDGPVPAGGVFGGARRGAALPGPMPFSSSA